LSEYSVSVSEVIIMKNKINLNAVVEPNEKAMKQNPVVLSSPASVSKRPYPGDKPFSFIDIMKLLRRFPYLARLIASLNRNRKLIQTGGKEEPQKLRAEDFGDLKVLMSELGVVSWGCCTLESGDLYAGKGVPYPQALVISIPMDKEIFNTVPSMEAQIEVIRVYGETGRAVNRISRFLRERGYNATPNHSVGGSVDYAKVGQKAGLGYLGRSGMLLTPESGSCHRLAAVYTSIANWEDFLPVKEDHSWVSEYCGLCGKCVRSCPASAIRETPLVDGFGNVSAVDYERCCSGFEHYGCGVCISVCPFTKLGYNKLKDIYIRTSERRQKKSVSA
jgi:ferredoxin